MIQLKLRTKIVFSYLLLIGIVICGFYIIFDVFAINVLTKAHLRAAQDGVTSMSQSNRQLSSETIQILGKNILDLMAVRDANRAAVYFDSKPTEYMQDVKAMRRDRQLREIVAHSIQVFDKDAGYTDLFDRTGVALIHPYPDLEGKSYSIWANEYPQMWKMVQESFNKEFVSGEYTFFDKEGKTVHKYMAISHIPNTNFNLVACVMINDYFVPVNAAIMKREGEFSARAEKDIFAATESSSQRVKLFSLPLILAAALISLLLGLWFSANIVRPLQALIDAVANLGQGNFAVNVRESGSQEVVELTRSFNRLGSQLDNYIQTLQVETAARQEVESEIKIARSLQESLLPKSFPKSDFYDLSAKLEPAKEVAGDFYDSFMVKGKLAIIIGDVSGKGVPAAFFMAITRTMLRDLCHSLPEITPALVLSRANQLLCLDNDSCMFVTLFIGFLDIDEGVLYYANGGHNEVLRRSADGEISCFGFTGDMALGIVPANNYRDCREKLNPGDTLVLFTDGITEAISLQQVLYGFERLSEMVSQVADAPAAEICDRVINDVITYEHGSRFDDITVVTLKLKA